MTIEDISKVYDLDQHIGGYLVWSKTEHGNRLARKYFCKIYEGENGFYVQEHDNSPVNSIEELEQQINLYVKSLPYNSENYMPLFNERCFVEFCVIDYLKTIGFKFDSSSGLFNGSSAYTCSISNIYGDKSGSVSIIINGLDMFDKKETVTISLLTGDWSWVETKCEREIEAVKKCINALLKPLFLSNVSSNMLIADKLTDEVADIIECESNGFFVIEKKLELKEKLQNLLNLL